MSIDVSRLSPWAQRQIAAKLLAKKQAKRKYNNTPAERLTDSGKTIRFDSQKEARRYDELMLLLKAGKIRNLRLQPQYTLQEAYTTPEGEHIRALKYVADFSYEYFTEGVINREGGGTWLPVVEDVKSTATKTDKYAIKKKLMQERYGISIREI